MNIWGMLRSNIILHKIFWHLIAEVIEVWEGVSIRMILWIFIFLAVIAAMLAGCVYLVTRFSKFGMIQKLSGENKKLRVALGALAVVLLLFVLWLAMDLINAMVCLIHLAVFWLLCDGAFWLVANKIKNQKPKRYYAGAAALVITAVYLAAGWFFANNVWRTAYTVETEKEIGRLRIVHFADSHVGTTFDGEEFAEYVGEMQAENPDVVLLTGDFVDDDTSKEDMVRACEALGTLQSAHGVYFCFGNHDKGYSEPEYRGYSGDDLVAELEKNGVQVLEDESVLIDNKCYIIGRQDISEEQRGSSRAEIQELVEPLEQDKFLIVMDHQPHEYDEAAKAGVDLVLSGHTHGGQFFPINEAGVWIGENDQTYGLETRSETSFIVTSGISDWAVQFKTGCKSEYVVIDVEGR